MRLCFSSLVVYLILIMNSFFAFSIFPDICIYSFTSPQCMPLRLSSTDVVFYFVSQIYTLFVYTVG